MSPMISPNPDDDTIQVHPVNIVWLELHPSSLGIREGRGEWLFTQLGLVPVAGTSWGREQGWPGTCRLCTSLGPCSIMIARGV